MTTNWASAATRGSNLAWINGSDAVFGGTGGVVTVSGTVSAASITFDATAYRLTNGTIALTGIPLIATGGNDVSLESAITGSAAITKTGTGTLVLGGPSTSVFSGTLTIAAGTVKTEKPSALGTTTGGTIISPGATLDLNGQELGNEPITVSGAGAGAGAILNSGAASLNSIRKLTMTGATTIGGTGNWAIVPGSTFAMGGHTLTKMGANEIGLETALATPGHIDVKEGSLLISSSNLGGTSATTVTVRSGATFGIKDNSTFINRSWRLILDPGSKWQGITLFTSFDPSWGGPVDIVGATTFEAVGTGSSISSGGMISGTGSVTKTGAGTWLISRGDYTGGTTVNEGTLRLSIPRYPFPMPSPTPSGTGTVRGPMTVNQGATLALASPNVLGTGAGARVNPLNVAGGRVSNEIDHDITAPPVLNLTGGRLETSKTPGSTSEGRYLMSGDAVVNSLPAATPSVISGAVQLATGNTGNRSIFDVADGAATDDLRIEAVIRGNSPANGLIKRGGGRLSLSGQATYQGSTVVEQGALFLIGPTSSLAASPVTAAAGTLVGVTDPGKSLASLSLQAGCSLQLPVVAGQPMLVTGALELAAGNIIIAPVLSAGTTPGIYDLLEAGSITGSGTPVLDLDAAFGPSRATGSLVVTGNKLQLILISTGVGLTWNNATAGGIANGTWNMTLANFSNGVSNDSFHVFDSVTFNDSVSGISTRTITLSGSLAPAQVTVNNSVASYTFSSTGRLVGMGSLVKTGTRNLKFAGPESYAMTGSITAGGGLLDFDSKTISASSLTLKAGATLSNATIQTGPLALESGTLNATLSGSAPWTKTTAGTVTVTATNKLAGPGTVSAGLLTVGKSTPPDLRYTLGSGPLEISPGATVHFINGGTAAGLLSNFSTDVENTFSGSGNLNFSGYYVLENGRSSFILKGGDGGFTGPVTINHADLFINKTGQLGTGPITIIGRTELNVDGATLPNAITFVSPNGAAVSNLDLKNATLSGPITAAGGLSNRIDLPSFDSSHCTISGPIGEAGGVATVKFGTINPGVPNPASFVTLSGNSTYTGPTFFGSMTLNLTGSLGATAVSYGSTAALMGNGTIGPGGSLNISNNGTLRVAMSGGALTVKGNVTLGTITKIAVDVTPDPVINGPIPVLNYTGTLTGGLSNLVIDSPLSYRKAEFALAPGLITLDIGTKALIWKGATGAAWDSTTSTNWGIGDGGTAMDYFFKGDSVVFDDSGAGGLVTAEQSVQPSSVVVDNSTKDYQLAAPIASPCSLTKRGSGTLSLSAANTYTGGTLVEAGRLEVSGTAGSGPISVSAAATLSGTGTLSGPVALAGTLDPGLSTQSAPAVLSTGPIALSGDYLCQLGQTSADRLAVTGDLDLTGSTLTLNKSTTAPGPALYVIATYTGTLTGEFAEITGMPSGHELQYDTAAKRIIVSRMPFREWIASFPGLGEGDTAADADPDHDGVANLVEYVIGGEPGTNDSMLLPTQTIEVNNLVFRYKRSDSSRSVTTQMVQWSPDAQIWTDVLVPNNTLSPVTITPNGDLPDDVSVTLPRLPGHMFVRLKVIEL